MGQGRGELACIVCILAGFICAVRGLEVTEQSLHIINGTFQQQSFVFANTRLEFSEDLYLAFDNSCDEGQEPNFVVTCRPCNYTVGADSDGLCREEGLNVDTIEGMYAGVVASLPPCECDRTMCGAVDRVVSVGTQTVVDIGPFREQVFAFTIRRAGGFVVEFVAENYGSFVFAVDDQPFRLDPSSALAARKRDFVFSGPNVRVCSNRLPLRDPPLSYFVHVRNFELGTLRVNFRPVEAFVFRSRGVPLAGPRKGEILHLPAPGDTPVRFDLAGAAPGAIRIHVPRCDLYSIYGAVPRTEGHVNSLPIVGEYRLAALDGPEATLPADEDAYIVTEILAGAVLSACPVPGTLPTFLDLRFGIAPDLRTTPAVLDLYVRNVTDGVGLVQYTLDSVTELPLSRALQQEVMLRCPCLPGDSCEPHGAPLTFQAVTELHNDLLSPTAVDHLPTFAFSNGTHHVVHCRPGLDDRGCYVLNSAHLRDRWNPVVFPYPALVRAFQKSAAVVSPFEIDFPVTLLRDGLGLMVSLRTRGQTNLTVLDTSRLAECTLQFTKLGLIHNAAGESLPVTPLRIADMPLPSAMCTWEDFRELAVLEATLTDPLLQVTVESVTIDDSAFFAAEALTFTDEYRACQDMSATMIEYTDVAGIVGLSVQCPVYNATDPCCNQSIAWDTCCAIRTVQDVPILAPLDNDDVTIGALCEDGECASTFVSDLREASYFFNQQGICEAYSDVGMNTDFVQHCADAWFGDPRRGYPCERSADCTDRFRTGRCDTAAGLCTDVRQAMTTGFVDCVLKVASPAERSVLALLSNTTDNLGEVLVSQLVGRGCVSEYGPASPANPPLVYRSVDPARLRVPPACGVCDGAVTPRATCIFPQACAPPTTCLDKRSGCVVVPLEDRSTCLEPGPDDLFCNWDSAVTDSAACGARDWFCAHCFNRGHCVPIPGPQTEQACAATTLCVDRGDVAVVTAQDPCPLADRCTQPCGRDVCASREECLAEGGICSDPDEIELAVGLVDSAMGYGPRDGVCIRPVAPFNEPPCELLYGAYDFRTRRGCVAMSECEPDGTGCRAALTTAADCRAVGGAWLALPIGKADCNGYEPPPAIEDRDSLCERMDGYTSPSSANCSRECDFPATLGEWVPGRWLEPEVVAAQWTRAEMVASYAVVNDTVLSSNSSDLRFDFGRSLFDSFLISSLYECFVLPRTSIFSVTAASCRSDGSAYPLNETLETRLSYPGLEPFLDYLGVTPYIPGYTLEGTDLLVSSPSVFWLCPEFFSSLPGSYGVLVGLRDSYGGEFCGASLVSQAWRYDFVGNDPIKPTLVFHDPNALDPLPVRNAKGASVGGIVGNGFSIEPVARGPFSANFSNDVVSLMAILIVQRSASVEAQQYDPRFVHFDVGVEVLDASQRAFAEEAEVRPINAKLAEAIMELRDPELLVAAEDFFGAIIPLPYRDEFRGARFFPIVRMENWETKNRDDVLSGGERITLILFACLYAIVGMVVVALIFVLVRYNRLVPNILLLFFGWLVCTLRVILSGLYANSHWTEFTLGQLFLIETPSFLILSMGSIILMSFAFATANLTSESSTLFHSKSYWLQWLVGQVFLVVLLVVVVVLMYTLQGDGTISKSCMGRITTTEEDKTVELIRIVYHSFLLLLAVGVSVVLIFRARMIYDKLHSITVLQLCTVSVFGVVLESLVWVIYSAIASPTPYFIIPLFFVEALPILALCHLIRPRNLRQLRNLRRAEHHEKRRQPLTSSTQSSRD